MSVERQLGPTRADLRAIADNLAILIAYVDRERLFQFANRTRYPPGSEPAHRARSDGRSVIGEYRSSGEALLSEADAAMYRAKVAGKAPIVVHQLHDSPAGTTYG
ncbi:MAG TPA: hypothetical protein VGJ10_03805 [Paraburkholderia sp.]|jgi:GGDEF domain-containing protein